MKKQIIKFAKEHKKELIVAGVIVGGVIVWNLPVVKNAKMGFQHQFIQCLVDRYARRYNFECITFCSISDAVTEADAGNIIKELEEAIIKFLRT